MGPNYLHDDNKKKGKKSARWTPNLPTGIYKVSVRYVSGTNRASNVPYIVTYSGNSSVVFVDQKVNGGQWVSLGTYTFTQGTSGNVEVRTTGTRGYVVADSTLFEQVFE